MESQENPVARSQQICEQPSNPTSVEKPNQQLNNQENQSKIPFPLPDSFQKQFEGGICRLQRRQNCLKIHIHFHKSQQKSANSIEELFTKQLEAQVTTFSLSNDYMSKNLRQNFKKVRDLYEFLVRFIGTNKITIDRQKIHLTLPQSKEIDIIFAQEIQLEKQRNKVVIDIEKIQDKLIQFSNKEWQTLNFVSTTLHNNQVYIENSHDQINQTTTEKNSLNFCNKDIDIQLEQLLEKEDSNTQEQSEEQLWQRLNRQEKKIQQFQQMFGEIFNFANKSLVSSQPLVINKPNYPGQERIVPEPSSSFPTNPLLPPGYTPPHLAKPIAPDGFASDSGLKFQANQTKKEKLRMSKQMLKMGYSVDEIIQRLKEIEMAQKMGKLQNKNAYVAPSQGPVRPFHIPRQNHSSMNFPPQRAVQLQRIGNQKRVRERLIGLLKEKRYKKLEDIQKHMAGEGIETTVEILKGMIDDIRAKNAQRKSQNQ